MSSRWIQWAQAQDFMMNCDIEIIYWRMYAYGVIFNVDHIFMSSLLCAIDALKCEAKEFL